MIVYFKKFVRAGKDKVHPVFPAFWADTGYFSHSILRSFQLTMEFYSSRYQIVLADAWRM